jgi:hypothetical protein
LRAGFLGVKGLVFVEFFRNQVFQVFFEIIFAHFAARKVSAAGEEVFLRRFQKRCKYRPKPQLFAEIS